MQDDQTGKIALLFCSKGIGDGLIFFVLAENLSRQGFKVFVYHDLLFSLQEWFPSFIIQKYPKTENLEELLIKGQLILINGDDRLQSKVIVEKVKSSHFLKSHCFFPSSRKADFQKGFSIDFHFNRDLHIIENLLLFCKKDLTMKQTTSFNGVHPPDSLTFRKNLKRVVIHPTSSSQTRMWPKKKFFQLAKKLLEAGFAPVFCISPNEMQSWKDENFFGASLFCSSIPEVAKLLFESGFFIGNDSGLSHLASTLGIPTLTICVSKRKKTFWKPYWALNAQVLPWLALPNIKFFRWREKYWKPFVSVNQVWKKFELISSQFRIDFEPKFTLFEEQQIEQQ